MKRDRDLVWSSEESQDCPACGRPSGACACGAGTSEARKSGGAVRVSRETKGRRGKAVTVIRGLALDAEALEDLARELKRLCGTGGTVKEGTIEIQGDQRDRVVAELAARGHAVKRAGG